MSTLMKSLPFWLILTLLPLLFHNKIHLFKLNFDNILPELSIHTPMEIINLFSMVITLISILIVYFSFSYLSTCSSHLWNKFFTNLFLFFTSMILLNLSNSFWMIWVSWEILGVSSFFLINFYNNWKSNNSSLLTLLLNRVGDSFLMMCIFILSELTSDSLESCSNTTLILIMLAMVSKCSLFPFNSWLPEAMSAPTPISALVHSSTLVVSGMLLLSKISELYHSSNFITLIFSISTFTLFYSSIKAIFDPDLKKILAYSTQSQISVILMSSSFLSIKVSMVYTICHAMLKALAFLNLGSLMNSMFSNQEARNISPYISNNNMASTCFTLTMMSMSGLMFSSMIYLKEEIISLFSLTEFFNFFIYMSMSMTISYSAKMIYLILNTKFQSLMTSNLNLKSKLHMIIFIFSISLGWLMNSNLFLTNKTHSSSLKTLNLIFLILLTQVYTLQLNWKSIYIESMHLFFSWTLKSYSSKIQNLNKALYLSLFIPYKTTKLKNFTLIALHLCMILFLFS